MQNVHKCFRTRVSVGNSSVTSQARSPKWGTTRYSTVKGPDFVRLRVANLRRSSANGEAIHANVPTFMLFEVTVFVFASQCVSKDGLRSFLPQMQEVVSRHLDEWSRVGQFNGTDGCAGNFAN